MRREESDIQIAIVRYFRKTYEGRIAAVPNGGWRSRDEASRLKREGVDAGHPDLTIYSPAGAFLMEVKPPHRKTHKNGGLSDAQVPFISELKAMGFRVAVVYSLSEAVRTFEEWRLPLRKARVRSEEEHETWL